MTVLPDQDEADEVLRLVDADPLRAFARALEIAGAASFAGDAATGSRAERAAALAAFHSGRVGEAVERLRRSVALARRAGSARLEGLARMSLAGQLSYTGRRASALREIDRALELLDGPDRFTALSQQGLILWNCGRAERAFVAYAAALQGLRDSGDDVGVYTLLLNRGAAHMVSLDLNAAEHDLVEAAVLASAAGDDLTTAYARANLGFVRLLRGDVPGALDVLGAAENRLRHAAVHVGEIVGMRAEALLAVRLLREARDAATEALTAFAGAGNLAAVASTRLLVAQIATIEGRVRPAVFGEAAGHARQAAREFRTLGQTDQVPVARLVELQARARMPGRERAVRLSDVEHLVEEATAAGWVGAALDGRLLAAEIARRRRRRSVALDHLRAASLLRHGRRPADLKARAWYAESLLRAESGQPVAAERAALRGLAVLDEFRVALPATDLRAHAAAHRADLCELGARVALGSRDPRRVLRWAERSRATLFLQRPVTPPSDPVLADRMAALRKAVLDLYESRADGTRASATDRLRGRVATLEREIRGLTRRSDLARPDDVRGTAARAARAATRPADLRDLAAELGPLALVEYLVVDGVLHAVTVVGRRTRLHNLGDVAAVAGLVERVPFAVQRMIRAARSPQGADAAVTLLADAGRRLDDLLLAPLPETRGRDLVVVPTGVLQALPWWVLPSCRGRALTVAPSATVWRAATRRTTSPGHAVVAAGPRLAGAPAEAAAVAATYGVDPVADPDAGVDVVIRALPGAAVAHLATHGRLSAENPLFSHLLLSDGPLVVYDLERLPSLPHTVVLAACESGRHVAPAGDELLGLAAAFLAGGTAQVVASVVPVPDAQTVDLMTALHAGLAAGSPPAVALARAQAAIAGGGPLAAATAAGFVCIGAGFVPVPLAPSGRA